MTSQTTYLSLRATHTACRISLLLFLLPSDLQGWGFAAHKKINEQAIYLLPAKLLSFYKKYAYYIREEATKPDKRRYAVEGEAQKHYINLENYYEKGAIPRFWHEALERYDSDFMRTYGTLPWSLYRLQKRLTQAFREKDSRKILRISADIGHYAADMHVPLHTTENYDGQKTNQQGIHALWETRLVELFMDEYDFVFDERATYLPDVQLALWKSVYETHKKASELLRLEQNLDATFPSSQKYVYEQRGQSLQRNYTRAYSRSYHNALCGMVEQQMRASIRMVASLWFSAWVDAGCPDLSDQLELPLEVLIEEEVDPEAPRLSHVRPHRCNE